MARQTPSTTMPRTGTDERPSGSPRGTSASPRRGSSRPSSRRPLSLHVAITVIVGVAVAVAVALTITGEGEVTGPQPPASVLGPSLPALEAGADPAVGALAPPLRGTELLTGFPLDVRPGAGRPLALLFVAHWCPHCQVEVKEVSAWLARAGYTGNDASNPFGVDIVTISSLENTSRPNWPPATWLRGEKWPTPVLADGEESAAAQAYGLSGTPFWVFVDAQGRVVRRSSGRMPVEALQSTLRQLAAGTLGR